MSRKKYIYETFGKTVTFALHNGFKPEIQEWESVDIPTLEISAIEYLEKQGYKVDLTNRVTKIEKMHQGKVAECWSQGIPANSWTGKYRTDGLLLYSYNLIIGTTDRNGKKIVFSYLTPSGAFVSASTGKHVGFAKKVTPFVRDPKEINKNASAAK